MTREPATLSGITSAPGSTVVADCLNRPTSFVRDDHSGAIYVTELVTGSVVRVSW